jgi:site-specific DNA-methyltransferase (adenine-specific)
MPFLDLFLRQHINIMARIIWHYDSSGVQAKSKYGSMYEPVLYCVKDPKNYTFNSEEIKVEAKTGAKRKLIDYRKAVPTPYNTTKVPGNVWSFPRVRYRMPEYEDHPTQKPEAFLERIIKASSNKKDVVLDPFSGTFTTSAVAKKLGRKSIGIDHELEYVKIGLRRIGITTSLDGEELLPPDKSYIRKNGIAAVSESSNQKQLFE